MTKKETIKDRLAEEFYNNGLLSFKRNYKNGNLEDLWEHFDQVGNLTKYETWENGKLVE